MPCSECLSQSFVVPSQPAKPAHPRERAFDHPASWQQHETLLGLVVFDHMQSDPVSGRIGNRLVPRVPLVHISQAHRLAGCFLDGRCKFCNLVSLLVLAAGHPQRQQVPECIHGDVDLRAIPHLVPIEPGPRSTLRGRLKGASVQNHGRGRWVASVGDPKQFPQVVDNVLKAPGCQPTPCLLVDGGPRREVVRQKPPLCTGLDHPTQGIERISQSIVPLPGILTQQGQIGGHKCPLFIRYIARVRFSSFHTPLDVPART